MNRNIVFLLNPSEITAGTRGSSLGPEAIMTAARNKKSTLFGETEVKWLDCVNHLLDRETPYPFAKRIDGLINIYESLNDKVSAILKQGSFPFVIAADHGSAGGTIAGIKSAFPQKRLGVLWIDAHADIHTPYTTPTGNMHGMPLATALGIDNLNCKVNEVNAETVAHWERLKNTGNITPKVQPGDIVYVAVRDTEEQEDCVMDELRIKNITVGEVREKGVAHVISTINEKFRDCDLIYVSFDVDSMDPELTSHGTGTPVDNGLRPEEAKAILEAMVQNPKLCCLEVVEVNPCLDEKINRMAEITFDIIESLAANLKK
jgi:arginase